ncbi:hypothetical protein D3C73_1271750 [compost metagenome]
MPDACRRYDGGCVHDAEPAARHLTSLYQQHRWIAGGYRALRHSAAGDGYGDFHRGFRCYQNVHYGCHDRDYHVRHGYRDYHDDRYDRCGHGDCSDEAYDDPAGVQKISLPLSVLAAQPAWLLHCHQRWTSVRRGNDQTNQAVRILLRLRLLLVRQQRL